MGTMPFGAVFVGILFFLHLRKVTKVAVPGECKGVRYLEAYDRLKKEEQLRPARHAMAVAEGRDPENEPPPLPQSANWFYEADGKKVGPVDLSQIEALANSGKLPRTALVWTKGMAGWQPLASLR